MYTNRLNNPHFQTMSLKARKLEKQAQQNQIHPYSNQYHENSQHDSYIQNDGSTNNDTHNRDGHNYEQKGSVAGQGSYHAPIPMTLSLRQREKMPKRTEETYYSQKRTEDTGPSSYSNVGWSEVDDQSSDGSDKDYSVEIQELRSSKRRKLDNDTFCYKC